MTTAEARTALKAAHTVEAKFEALDQVFLETLQVLHVEAAPLDSDDEESDEKEYSPPAQDDTEDESTPSPPSKGKGKAEAAPKAAPKAATKGVTVAKTRKYEPRANKISTGNNSTAVQRWINGICIPCSKKNTKCIFRYAKSGARKHCCEECLRRKIKCTKEPLGTDDEEHLPSDQDTDLPDSDEPVQGIAQRSGTQGRIEELEYLVADLQERLETLENQVASGSGQVIPPEFYYVFTTEKAEEAFRRPESIKEWPPRSDESLRFLADAADLAAASIRADEPSRFPTKWYWLDSVLNQVIRGIRAMDELDKEPWNPEWDNSDQLVYFDKLAPLKPCCQYVFGEEDAERASRSSLFLLEQQKADKCPGLLTIAARLILKDDAAGPDQFEDPLHWLDSYLATAIIQVHPELEALLDTGSEEEPSDSDDSEYTEERPLPSGPSQHSGSQAQRKPRGKAEKSADTKRTEALPSYPSRSKRFASK
ncbi:hypothetical protein BDZ89DRAFT_1143457 [Hymenopellis radicata]|nr:hypothetical protein BDZ89DRAFT_1148557 [Hymenopellis radicata]KAF9004837.1 hypothetical protein BDZ89DRAFT_1145518 [Hymenopellis radicata]KAF9010896.1 hypothetical protein BDZ89DRAFT_1143457 [Hymenopellis radicata]